MALPELPHPRAWRSRRRRGLRWLADTFNLWALAMIAVALIVLWLVSAMPLVQTVEGTVETRAISFLLRPSTQDGTADDLTGFLAETPLMLRISALRDGAPVSFPLKGRTVRLDQGRQVVFLSPARQPFAVKLLLPPGSRVDNLHGEETTGRGGKQLELVMDLRVVPASRTTSSAKGDTPMPIELSLTPPAAGESKSGLLAVVEAAGEPEQPLTTPEGTFSLPLEGDLRLRMSLAAPSVVFEPNLPVAAMTFSSVKPSSFGRGELLLSNLRQGTLHFGRHETLMLRESQFLTIGPPGILELTDLRLANNTLVALISGQTTRLSTGLSPNRASTEIKGTLLSRSLSPEQISGVYGFFSGVIGSMVLVFFRAD
jgi:hypothetical protein